MTFTGSDSTETISRAGTENKRGDILPIQILDLDTGQVFCEDQDDFYRGMFQEELFKTSFRFLERTMSEI